MYDLIMYSGYEPDGNRICNFYAIFKEDNDELKAQAIAEIYSIYLILSKDKKLDEKNTQITFVNQDSKETCTLEELVCPII